MKKAVLILFIIATSSQIALSQEGASRKKALLIPFASRVDTNVYQAENAAVTEEIVFRSVYFVIGFLPSVDMPEYKSLRAMTGDISNTISGAKGAGEDLVIFGDYSFEGSRQDPSASINLNIWTADGGRTGFSKKYKTTLGVEMFDTIDEMIADIIEYSLKVKPKFATVQFGNFDISGDNYLITINKKPFMRVTNRNFSVSQKVMGGEDYNISIFRERDRASVLNSSIRLAGGETTNIGYKGKGEIRIGNILNKDSRKEYQIYLDGTEVAEGHVMQNARMDMEHSVLLMDKKTGGLVQVQNFTVMDGETRIVSLTDEFKMTLRHRIYTGGECLLGIGSDLGLSDRVTAGLNIGMSVFSASNSAPINSLSASVECAYCFWDNPDWNVRVSAGGSVYFYYLYSASEWPSLNLPYNNFSFPFGAFAQAEWAFLYGRVFLGFDYNIPSHFVFYPSIGVKF